MAAGGKQRLNKASLGALIDRSGYGTRTAFAAAVGISTGTLSDLLSGRRQPSLALTERLSAELKVPVTAILINPEEM